MTREEYKILIFSDLDPPFAEKWKEQIEDDFDLTLFFMMPGPHGNLFGVSMGDCPPEPPLLYRWHVMEKYWQGYDAEDLCADECDCYNEVVATLRVKLRTKKAIDTSKPTT
jgi:hypothetical protein